jgi:hypothetical protein
MPEGRSSRGQYSDFESVAFLMNCFAELISLAGLKLNRQVADVTKVKRGFTEKRSLGLGRHTITLADAQTEN